MGRVSLACALLLAAPFAAAQSNPAARPARDATALVGTWFGAHLEQRSSCVTAGNNGFHGTYSQYNVRIDAPSRMLILDEIALTGLTCNYAGTYGIDGTRITWSGRHTCTDGRDGPFQAQDIFAFGNVMRLHLSVQLSGGELCAIDAVMGGTRF